MSFQFRRSLTAFIFVFVFAFGLVGTSQSFARSGIETLNRLVAGKPVTRESLEIVLTRASMMRSTLQSLGEYDFRVVRNALYALKGAKFHSKELTATFSKQGWYVPHIAASKVRLGLSAQKNMMSLLKAEKFFKILGFRIKGEMPVNIEKIGSTHCFIYKKYIIQEKNKWIYFDRVRKKNTRTCALSRGTTRVRKDEGSNIRGYEKGFVLLLEKIDGDQDKATLIDLSKSAVVFKHPSFSPASEFDFEENYQVLVFPQDLPFPKACAKKGQMDYNKMVSLCWSQVQKMHPVLKRTAAPKCKCPVGMGIYLAAQYMVDLRNIKKKPSLTGKLYCGCAS